MKLVVYGHPLCGHTKIVLRHLEARSLSYEERHLDESGVPEGLVRTYGVRGGPALIVGHRIVVGTREILKIIETMSGHVETPRE